MWCVCVCMCVWCICVYPSEYVCIRCVCGLCVSCTYTHVTVLCSHSPPHPPSQLPLPSHPLHSPLPLPLPLPIPSTSPSPSPSHYRWKKLEHTMEEMDLPDEEVWLHVVFCTHSPMSYSFHVQFPSPFLLPSPPSSARGETSAACSQRDAVPPTETLSSWEGRL